MKQISKSEDQFDFLDPEKVYFVEKFGYLVKKINGGYGGPVQEALFDRINKTVNNFKNNLPNFVHNLEINRQKIISSQKKINITGQISEKYKLKSKLPVSARAAEATRIISEKISTVEKEGRAHKSDVARMKPILRGNKRPLSDTQVSNISKPILKSSVIKKEIEVTNLLAAKQASILKNKTSSILQPSVAAIREEQHLEQLKAMQEKKESLKSRPKSKQAATKPKPVQELTEWERRWHKYDSDLVDLEFNGYLNS